METGNLKSFDSISAFMAEFPEMDLRLVKALIASELVDSFISYTREMTGTPYTFTKKELQGKTNRKIVFIFPVGSAGVTTQDDFTKVARSKVIPREELKPIVPVQQTDMATMGATMMCNMANAFIEMSKNFARPAPAQPQSKDDSLNAFLKGIEYAQKLNVASVSGQNREDDYEDDEDEDDDDESDQLTQIVNKVVEVAAPILIGKIQGVIDGLGANKHSPDSSGGIQGDAAGSQSGDAASPADGQHFSSAL